MGLTAALTPAGRTVLAVRGVLDRRTAPRLVIAIERAVRLEHGFALDVSAVEPDSDGTANLLALIRRLHRRRCDLVVICPPGNVRIAIDGTALARRTAVVDNRESVDEVAWPAATPPPVSAVPRRSERAWRAATLRARAALLVDATAALERRHSDPTLVLGDVALEITTSNRQLQRVFAELAGSAFRDELAAIRMQHGSTLLLTTDLPVSEVARHVGYRQAAQFAKAFRRHHGVSPSGFRRAPG